MRSARRFVRRTSGAHLREVKYAQCLLASAFVAAGLCQSCSTTVAPDQQAVTIAGSREALFAVQVPANREFRVAMQNPSGGDVGTVIWGTNGELLAMNTPAGGGTLLLGRSPVDRRVTLQVLNTSAAPNTLVLEGGRGETLETRPVTGAVSWPSPPGRTIVPVLYATDRQAITENGNLTYGTRRNPDEKLYLGRFDVSIPRDDRHKVGRIERPDFRSGWILIPDRHFHIVGRWQTSYEDFYRGVSELVQGSPAKQAFVFIHGFNVAFEDAVYRTAQMAYDLQFDGAPMLYSWPSEASLSMTGYTTDVGNNDWTVMHLRSFLEDVAAKTGAKRVHLIAHSMGNRALVNALARMSESSTKRFAHVVLTAPDMDAATFVQLADAVKRQADATTLYASANDKAMAASKQYQRYCRAGDTSCGVVVVPGIETIDVSAVDTDLVGHFYYGDNRSVISDMFALLTQGLPPAQRFGLRVVGSPPKQYWRFAP